MTFAMVQPPHCMEDAQVLIANSILSASPSIAMDIRMKVGLLQWVSAPKMIN